MVSRSGCACRMRSSTELTQIAHRRGVSIAPGSLMSTTGRFDEFVRLSFDHEEAVLEERDPAGGSRVEDLSPSAGHHRKPSRLDVVVLASDEPRPDHAAERPAGPRGRWSSVPPPGQAVTADRARLDYGTADAGGHRTRTGRTARPLRLPAYRASGRGSAYAGLGRDPRRAWCTPESCSFRDHAAELPRRVPQSLASRLRTPSTSAKLPLACGCRSRC